MDAKELKKEWTCWLMDIGKTNTEVAKECGQGTPSNLQQKIANGTIRHTELADIVEHYGYDVSIRKKE